MPPPDDRDAFEAAFRAAVAAALPSATVEVIDRTLVVIKLRETYRNCSDGVQVELCSVNANQNSWGAGHATYLNPDIDIPQTAWDFLSQFRLPAE